MNDANAKVVLEILQDGVKVKCCYGDGSCIRISNVD